MFQSINPWTEELFSETAPLPDKGLEAKLHLSEKAFSGWSTLSVEERALYVRNLKAILEEQKQEIATLSVKEMGKPMSQSLAEIEKCAKLCDYVAEHAPHFLKDKPCLPSAPDHAYVTYQPLGIILGIMPWNFPFWQVFRFALPTLLCGNTVLVKHAPNVMLCAIALEKLFLKAGFPTGVYQNLPIVIEKTKKIIADRRIKGVSLTGSVRAGRSVASLAGQHLKKTLLELGGSDPYIILDDADLTLSAKECVLSRMNNSGQSCIAAKRFIVTKKKVEEFTFLIKQNMKTYQAGDPMSFKTKLGPLARKDLRDTLHQQTKKLIKHGATSVFVGKPTTPADEQKKGYTYPPTVLSCSAEKSALCSEEELFGPVAVIVVVRDEAEALQIANHSPYGLGAAVFSQDLKKAQQWAHQLQVGSCALNQALHSHPALPFGGVKDSGYGRELSSFGFFEFANIKTNVCSRP